MVDNYELEDRLRKMAADADYIASSFYERAEEFKNNGDLELAIQTMVIVDTGHRNADDLRAAARAVQRLEDAKSKSRTISAPEALRQLADKAGIVHPETLRIKAHRLESGDPDWANPNTDTPHRVDRSGRDEKIKALGAAEYLEGRIARMKENGFFRDIIERSWLEREAAELRREASA